MSMRVRRNLVFEQKCDGPETGKTDQSIDDTAGNGKLSAEQVSDNVDSEQTDTAPVQRADNYQRETDIINCVHKLLPFYGYLRIAMLVWAKKRFLYKKEGAFAPSSV